MSQKQKETDLDEEKYIEASRASLRISESSLKVVRNIGRMTNEHLNGIDNTNVLDDLFNSVDSDVRGGWPRSTDLWPRSTSRVVAARAPQSSVGRGRASSQGDGRIDRDGLREPSPRLACRSRSRSPSSR